MYDMGDLVGSVVAPTMCQSPVISQPLLLRGRMLLGIAPESFDVSIYFLYSTYSCLWMLYIHPSFTASQHHNSPAVILAAVLLLCRAHVS